MDNYLVILHFKDSVVVRFRSLKHLQRDTEDEQTHQRHALSGVLARPLRIGYVVLNETAP